MSERKTVRYYLAEGDEAAKIYALFADDAETRKAAKRLCRDVGATDVFSGQLQGGVVGFSFADETTIDKTLFRYDARGCWRPRRGVKAGRDLWARMSEVRFHTGDDFAKAIGVKTFLGGRWCTPGVQKIGDTYLLTVDSEAGTPRNCRRISDIEAEELRRPKRKKRKAS